MDSALPSLEAHEFSKVQLRQGKARQGKARQGIGSRSYAYVRIPYSIAFLGWSEAEMTMRGGDELGVVS